MIMLTLFFAYWTINAVSTVPVPGPQFKHYSADASDEVFTYELDILYREAWDTLRFLTSVQGKNVTEATKNTLVVSNRRLLLCLLFFAY